LLFILFLRVLSFEMLGCRSVYFRDNLSQLKPRNGFPVLIVAFKLLVVQSMCKIEHHFVELSYLAENLIDKHLSTSCHHPSSPNASFFGLPFAVGMERPTLLGQHESS